MSVLDTVHSMRPRLQSTQLPEHTAVQPSMLVIELIVIMTWLLYRLQLMNKELHSNIFVIAWTAFLAATPLFIIIIYLFIYYWKRGRQQS